MMTNLISVHKNQKTLINHGCTQVVSCLLEKHINDVGMLPEIVKILSYLTFNGICHIQQHNNAQS
jgi:hypothetical protein